MSLKLRDLTEDVVLGSIQDFYDHTSGFMERLAKIIANQTYTVQKSPRRRGVAEFPYFYAVELYELFEFARARHNASASYIDKRCDEVLAILHTTVLGRQVEPDWAEFGQSPMGLCLLACRARVKLRREEDWLSADDVLLLASWEQRHFERSGLVATDTEDGPRYASADVRKALQSQGIAV